MYVRMGICMNVVYVTHLSVGLYTIEFPTPQSQKFSHNKAHTQGRFSHGNQSPSSGTCAKRNGNSSPSSNVSVNVAEP